MFRTSVATAFSQARQFSSSAARNSFARMQILGRVGQDVMEAESASGKSYVRYSVAVQTRKDAPVSWFNVVSFNEAQNNFLTQYVRRGSLVHVSANVKNETYEKEDGSKVTSFTVIQSSIELLHTPRSEEAE